MRITIQKLGPNFNHSWDEYVKSHPYGTLYHLSGWKDVIEKTYGHKTYYLMAVNSSKFPGETGSAFHRAGKAQSSKGNCLTANQLSAASYARPVKSLPSEIRRAFHQGESHFTGELHSKHVVGILPLVHLKHFLFGNSLISIPFFDFAGILSNDEEVEKALFFEAIDLGQQLKVDNIEFRNTQPLSWTTESSKLPVEIGSVFHRAGKAQSSNQITMTYQLSDMGCIFQTQTHKVRMMFDLPESAEILMKSFKSKLRSQIKKPVKEGLNARIGGMDLLDDFYQVFSINMRDLGSPVHSKKLLRNVLEVFTDQSRTIVVYKDNQAAAGSLVVGFKDVLENPWASALRKFSRLSPNMLLYWTMLKFACDNSYKQFDFGRSSPGEGTFRFKKQWGASPIPLYWHYISLKDDSIQVKNSQPSSFERAIRLWQKLPVPVTRIIGPKIRKHIGL